MVSYHDSWPYSYRAYGLIELGVIEDRPGVPPTPQHLTSLIRQMKEQGVRVVVLESWYPPDTAAAVARLAGAKLVVIPQSPDAEPGAADYLAPMDHVLTTLPKALADPRGRPRSKRTTSLTRWWPAPMLHAVLHVAWKEGP